MRVWFESSHLSGDFLERELRVRVCWEDPGRQTTLVSDMAFEVPPSFHVHNDLVAAALMLLVGSHYSEVAFNFPISSKCAALLRRAYTLDDVGPVAEDLEPRQRGRYLGLCLSGGLDSMAVWLLLRRALGDDFRVLTAAFGDGFAFEQQGYSQFRRDVTCRTTLRRHGLPYGVRMVFVVPLLFADYADIGALTTGHHFLEVPLSIDSLRDGQRPSFLDEDISLHAGGVDEVHIARALNAAGLLKVGLSAPLELQEACFYGAAPRGTLKHFDKGLALRILYAAAGRPRPAWLEDIAPPRAPTQFGGSAPRFFSLFIMQRLGPAAMRPAYSDIDCYDLDFLTDMSLAFMERYNTNLTQYLPGALRAPLLAAMHATGLQPYAEQDWAELDIIRRYNQALSSGCAPLRAEAGCAGLRSVATGQESSRNADLL
ncbi:MAG: hypothetical protein DCC58_13790 [Chloroflexi bacterium]|nr:MAG: hypothetical protein DCC58_13790 [Chloroflexota bacterium]